MLAFTTSHREDRLLFLPSARGLAERLLRQPEVFEERLITDDPARVQNTSGVAGQNRVFDTSEPIYF